MWIRPDRFFQSNVYISVSVTLSLTAGIFLTAEVLWCRVILDEGRECWAWGCNNFEDSRYSFGYLLKSQRKTIKVSVMIAEKYSGIENPVPPKFYNIDWYVVITNKIYLETTMWLDTKPYDWRLIRGTTGVLHLLTNPHRASCPATFREPMGTGSFFQERRQKMSVKLSLGIFLTSGFFRFSCQNFMFCIYHISLHFICPTHLIL